MGRVLVPVLLYALLALALRAGHAEEPGAPAGDDLAERKADLLLRLKVRRAIDLGARWVASCQQRDGSFRLDGNPQDGPFPESRHRFGASALCTYTLADCGYDAQRDEIRKAVAYLRKHYRSYLKGDHWPQASSYSLSLVVLALHTLYAKPAESDARDQPDRYAPQRRKDANPCDYPAWARAMIDDVLDWLVANQAPEGLFRYPGGLPGGPDPAPGRPPAFAGPEDLSNTQYVLLALWAGSRCGYDVPVETLERIARRLLAVQEPDGPRVDRVEDPAPEGAPPANEAGGRYAPPSPPDGRREPVRDRVRGFGYVPGGVPTGSMSTAGLSSLVIVKAMLLEREALQDDLRKALDEGIWDAIAWLAYHYDLRSNPGMGTTWQYYYLYGLERACVIAAKRFLGEHDWYREGASMLVADQAEDGRWAPPGQLGSFGAGPAGPSIHRTDLLDTCFALLFLKRATLIPEKPVLEEPPPPVTTPRAR